MQEPSRAAQAIARRAAESRATVPEIELVADADLGAAAALRALDPALSITALLVRASALALRHVPRANGAYRDGRFELYSRVNVAVGVPMGEAIAMPTLFDADRKSPRELSDELQALAARAQAGELTSPEQSGATFSLVNAGGGAVRSSSVMFTPPHAAALCAGAIRDAAIVRSGIIEAGLVMTLTLACDHRILYGAPAAQLLGEIVAGLEQPSRLARE